MKNLLLALIAISLTFLIPIGIVYSVFTRGLHGLRDIAKDFAIAWDRLGGAVCKHLFNDWLVKSNGYRFGNGEDTISYVLGINKRDNTLTILGKGVANLINLLDPNHVEKAVRNKNQ